MTPSLGTSICYRCGPKKTKKKKNKQTNKKKTLKVESLSFIWGRIRTYAQEIAAQVALRNRSKEVRGNARTYRSFSNKGQIAGKKEVWAH